MSTQKLSISMLMVLQLWRQVVDQKAAHLVDAFVAFDGYIHPLHQTSSATTPHPH